MTLTSEQSHLSKTFITGEPKSSYNISSRLIQPFLNALRTYIHAAYTYRLTENVINKNMQMPLLKFVLNSPLFEASNLESFNF